MRLASHHYIFNPTLDDKNNVISHKGEGDFVYALSFETSKGIPIHNYGVVYVNDIPLAMSLNEYEKHTKRQRYRLLRLAYTGLNCPIYGHMNKHLLKMKYLRKKEGIKLAGQGHWVENKSLYEGK